MTRAEIHQRALLTAAKATLSVAALGCGAPREPVGPAPSTTTVEVPPRGNQPAASAVSPAATAAPSARKASCLGSGPPYSKDQINCCALVVKNELPPQEYPLSKLPPDQEQCCQLIVGESDAGRAPGREVGLNYGDAYACCGRLDPLPHGPTCTPWGPPMPPPMDAALQDEVFA